MYRRYAYTGVLPTDRAQIRLLTDPQSDFADQKRTTNQTARISRDQVTDYTRQITGIHVAKPSTTTTTTTTTKERKKTHTKKKKKKKKERNTQQTNKKRKI